MAVPEQTIQTRPELGCLAVVVDSSVALAGNWNTILKYLGLFVQRLVQTNHGAGYRIAWVTYGPPHSSPSSLLCKRFFAEIVEVTAVLTAPDELHQLGIGTTPCGGTRGMAMLEGLVAAVELFDTLNEIPRKSPSHIFHITASFPDNAQHPRENMSPSLDEITWKTLPEELSKRNILMSSVVLNPKTNTKIPEIHSSVTLNTAPTSWLTVDPPHVAYVASLSLPQKGMKRPADQMNVAEQPPEKRHQTNLPSVSPPRNKPNNNVNMNTNSASSTSSSKLSSSGPSSLEQPKLPGAPDQPQVGQPPQPNPPPNFTNLPPLNSTQKFPWPGIGSLTPNELLQRWKHLEEMRRRADGFLAQATNAGDTAKIEAVKQQIAQYEPLFVRVRTVAMNYYAALKRVGMTGGQVANAMTGAGGQVQPPISTGGAPNINPNASNPNITSQTQKTQPTLHSPKPNPPSSIIPSPATKPNDGSMPGSSSMTSDSSALVPLPSSSASTKPSPKHVPKPSPKLTAVKPSPKSKSKVSPVKNTSSIASNASTASSTIAPSSAATSTTSTVDVTGHGPSSTSGFPIPSNLPPEAALQMQKLMEQGGRGHPRDMAMGSMGQGSPNLAAAGVAPQQPQGQPGQPSQVGGVIVPGTMPENSVGLSAPSLSNSNVSTPSTSAGGPARNGGIPAWTGFLSYSNEQGGARKDIKISVMAMSANHLECRAHTWPSEMILSHSRDAVVSFIEFQMWAKKTRPVVCTLKPHARNPDARQIAFNEQVFNGIQAMIRNSKTYIVSSWTLPSGAQTNNVLFALVPPHGFIGAFFPASGIPEMPKPIPGSNTMTGGMLGGLPMGVNNGGMGAPGGAGGGAAPGSNLGPPSILTILQTLAVHPDVASRILQLPPEGQMQAIKSLVQAKQGLQRSQGQGGAGGAPGQVGIPGMQKPVGSNVNITAAAAAMALRMKQSGLGMSPGMQGIGTHGTLQGMPGLNMAGMQRQASGQDGLKTNQQSTSNMAALFMRGNMGGMGGINAVNMGANMNGGSAGGNMPIVGGAGTANMSLQQQMAQMQQMQQNRAAFGGVGPGGSGAGGTANLSMDMLQSFMHRNGQEGQGGVGGQP